MRRYVTTIKVPADTEGEYIYATVEKIREIAYPRSVSDDQIVVEFQLDDGQDLYDLAEMVLGLEGEIQAQYGIAWSIPRPTVVRRKPVRAAPGPKLPTGKDLEQVVFEALESDWDLPSSIEYIVLSRCFPATDVEGEGWDRERDRIRLALTRLVKAGRAEQGGWNDIEWRKR